MGSTARNTAPVKTGDMEIGKKISQIIDIIRHPDYNFPVRPGVKVVKGKFLQLVKNILPDGGNHPLAHNSRKNLVDKSDSDIQKCQKNLPTTTKASIR